MIFKEDKMDLLAIENLRNIIDICQFPHICLTYHDADQIIVVMDKSFYRAHWKYSSRTVNGKRGFFNNGKTTLWESRYDMENGTIRIGTRPVGEMVSPQMFATGTPMHGWSDPFSFTEKDSLLHIHKYMKMKAFW